MLNLMLFLQLFAMAGFAQLKLSGTVKGNGNPLPGASVIIVDSYYGVSTSGEGTFEFKNLKKGEYTVQFSFIGYATKLLKVNLESDKQITVNLEPNVILTDEVLVSATRADQKTPMAFNNITGEEIARQNMGQDIPYLLQLTPSFVATSDAGAGVGYTNFRIRGTDLNRINVSLNGIPLNDAESHGTWFVDLPDLASSLENVQIQRGVGTSANGAAAFGASINLQTNTLNKNAYGKYKTAFGSFNTFKNTLAVGSGLLNGKWAVDARLSKVSSNGYIDRAASDLKSFFVSAGYYTDNTILRATVLSGFEETYQAWWGVPSVRLNDDLEGMLRYEEHWLYTPEQTQHMINSDCRTYNYYTYENQVDHYQQDNYQLHFSHKINSAWYLNTSIHYTYGRGYYENFKEDEKLSDYQLPDIVIGSETIETTDMVNRKWLDNDFWGITYSLNYNKNRSELTFGGGYNHYIGNHFGNVIWAKMLGDAEPNYEWYRNKGNKKDFNIYTKYNYSATDKLYLFADIQYRKIGYTIEGIDDDLRTLGQEHRFDFFNPKLGILYKPAGNQQLYLSFAIANREPNRTAYVDKDPNGKTPEQETLRDWELGYHYSSAGFSFAANYYYMCYKDQLVLTGEINDVGAPIMVNVDKSFRTGIELQGGIRIWEKLRWNGNSTFSINKIKDFAEYVDNWDTSNQEVFELGTTDLAFSPEFTGKSRFEFIPISDLTISFVSSYVSKQFIDNTSNNDRILDAYFENNIKADYKITSNLFKEITLHAMVNNLFNEKYESNAWVYSYIYGGERYKMDGYFPQAGTHFMMGIDFIF